MKEFSAINRKNSVLRKKGKHNKRMKSMIMRYAKALK
jgi:hypothetical protein